MASALSDDEDGEELVEDEYTYSPTPSSQGSHLYNANDVVPSFSHQSSSTTTFNSSFYNSFPVDTTFLETPNSSTHSMRSHLACRSSEATDGGGIACEGGDREREREHDGDTREGMQRVDVVPDDGDREPSLAAVTSTDPVAAEAAQKKAAVVERTAGKSRQLLVTHFFKPMAKPAVD
jgi:hypothetical protein